jgi:signal transduction histidine kinase
MQERRTTIRCVHPDRAQYCPSEDPVPRDGRLADLSERGVRVFTREAHPLGERITVSFRLPGEPDPLTVTGSVRWSNPQATRGGWHATGLEWLPLDGGAGDSLQSFLNGQALAAPRRWQDLRRRKTVTIRSDWLRAGLWAGVLAAVMLVAVMAGLKASNHRLGEAVERRNALIAQLERRAAELTQQLRTTKVDLGMATAELSGMDEHLRTLQREAQRLSDEVERFQRSYTRVREEREQLIVEVLRLEQQRMELSRRLASLPELRLAIQEAIQARIQAERAQRAAERQARLLRLREEEARPPVRGNQGYVVFEGRPVIGGWTTIIRVHEPHLLESIQ